MQNIFQSQISKVNDIKSGYGSPLSWIIKYIENQEWFINENFFWNNKIITQTIIDEKLNEFDKKLLEIKKLKKETLLLKLSEVEKKFLINSLNITGLKYILFKNSIYLEAEKYWFDLTQNDRKKYLKNINRLQDIIYGPEISSIDSEKEAILDNLKDFFLDNESKLSQDEKQIFASFLSWFEVNLDIWKTSKSEDIQDKLTKTFISKDTFTKIFNIILDIYNLDGWNISIEKVWNFSVRKEKKQIVCPESKIETTHLKRLFQIIDHEVWVHAIRWYNTDKTIKTSWEWYLEAEEWFATLTELLFDKNLDEIKLKPTLHHITTFIAENFNAEQTKNILKIYYKMFFPDWTSQEKIDKESQDRTLRIKRFVSLKEKWANRKDVSYTRWQSQIVKFLQSSNNQDILSFEKDFYFTKLSFDDIWLVNEFRENLDIDNNELRYPLWIWKILYKKFLWEKIFLRDLQEEDFRFKNIEKITFWVKRKIIKILQVLRK